MKSSAFARRLLLTVSFLTFFDRALLPPLLPLIARDLGVSVEVVGLALVAYVVAYAAAQLLWSVVSSRVGRVRTLAVATSLAFVGIVVSALAVDATMLIVGRTISGAAIGATVPAVLTYFGDTLTMKARAIAAANLAATLSVGLTVGTLVGSFTADWIGWRAGFGIAALLAALLGVLLFLVPEPTKTVPQGFFPAILRVFRNRWALIVLSLTVVEGALLVGVLNYIPVALQDRGYSVVIAGLAAAVFGVSVVFGSQLTKVLLSLWPAWVILLAGGLGVAFAYGMLAIAITFPVAASAAGILGFAWAFAHTQMQTWMTDAVADARPVGMSLFAVALFGGGSIGVALANAAAASHAFMPLFIWSAAVALAFAVAASFARRRYPLVEQAEE